MAIGTEYNALTLTLSRFAVEGTRAVLVGLVAALILAVVTPVRAADSKDCDALCMRVLGAAEPERPIDPRVLAFSRQLAEKRAVLLHLDDYGVGMKIVSIDDIKGDTGIVGGIGSYVMKSNPGRQDDVVRYVQQTLLPAVVNGRDEFVCRMARRHYAMLMHALAEAEKTQGRARADVLQEWAPKFAGISPYTFGAEIGPEAAAIDYYYF